MNAVTEPTRLEFIEPDEPAANAVTVQAPTTPAQLLAVALQQGTPIEQIRELMQLEREWRKDMAVQAYNDAFAAFKSEAVEIIKRKRVHFTSQKGTTDYKHAELSDVVEAVTPALSRHGLSASWSMKQEKDWLWVTCTLKHRAGHSDSATLGGPPDTSGNKNPVQSITSTKTMLERQTLKAVCGVSEKGEDDDGGGGKEQVDAELQAFRDAAMGGVEALRKFYEKRQPTEAFWLKNGKTLRQAARAADEAAGKKESAK